MGDRVVGVSNYCDYPAPALKLPKVGGFVDPSLERIVALRPTIVIGSRSPSNRGVVDALQARGITTLFARDSTLSELDHSIRDVARAVHVEVAGVKLAESLSRELHAVARPEWVAAPKPRVLFLVELRPLVGVGPGAFLDEALPLMATENVLRTGPMFPTLDPERVRVLNPDVIVLVEHDNAAPHADDEISIAGVSRDRIVFVRDSRLLRPSPRFSGGVLDLASRIH